MIKYAALVGLRLRGGCVLAQIELADGPLEDALGREAVAQTRIQGQNLFLVIRPGMSRREISVTLYHEVLEAVTVAAANPPVALFDFNEGDFERAARLMHGKLGEASAANLNRMLQFYGFCEE